MRRGALEDIRDAPQCRDWSEVAFGLLNLSHVSRLAVGRPGVAWLLAVLHLLGEGDGSGRGPKKVVLRVRNGTLS